MCAHATQIRSCIPPPGRWLSVRLESLGAAAAFAAAVLAVEQRGAAALAGNILSAALAITPLLSMTIRAASLAENAFNAGEWKEEKKKERKKECSLAKGRR